jgi:hypothetical protein
VFRRNVGGLDRGARVAIGIVLLTMGLLLLGGLAGETVGLALAGVGFIGLASGATGFCPLYVALGVSTARQTHVAGGGRW